MKLTKKSTKIIIQKLLASEDYRVEVVRLVDEIFLQTTIDFFREIIDAKLNKKALTDADWYKEAFLNEDLAKDAIATNAGINLKTITNARGTARKEVVLEESIKHYDEFLELIKDLAESESEFSLKLTLKFGDISVDLSLSESLIVINALAVKRAALRGGAWSTAGKQVEAPLMETLCRLYKVPEENYSRHDATHQSEREVDFYLLKGGDRYTCEVKLMGKGNPESADGAFARESKIFIADTLSDKNQKQLDKKGVLWIMLRSDAGFRRFKSILETLGIDHQPPDEADLQKNIDIILEDILS